MESDKWISRVKDPCESPRVHAGDRLVAAHGRRPEPRRKQVAVRHSSALG